MRDAQEEAHRERGRVGLFVIVGMLILATVVLTPFPGREQSQNNGTGTSSEACASTDPSGQPITGECRDFGIHVPSNSPQNLLQIMWEEVAPN